MKPLTRRMAIDPTPTLFTTAVLAVITFAVITFAMTVGCGRENTDVVSLPAPRITVIGLDGQKQSILSNELYDPETGQPTVRSVLVIDRQSNRQVFLDIDQLPSEGRAGARYILVTESPGASE